MKNKYYVIDPYDHEIEFECKNYRHARELAGKLSKISGKGVEIKRKPIPYDHQQFVLSL